MAAATRQIAERIVQGLEAADGSLSTLPGQIAARVLVALGSSDEEHEALARRLAGLFHSGLVNAVEATVRLALQHLGE
jgi:hypothetical protein